MNFDPKSLKRNVQSLIQTEDPLLKITKVSSPRLEFVYNYHTICGQQKFDVSRRRLKVYNEINLIETVKLSN